MYSDASDSDDEPVSKPPAPAKRNQLDTAQPATLVPLPGAHKTSLSGSTGDDSGTSPVVNMCPAAKEAAKVKDVDAQCTEQPSLETEPLAEPQPVGTPAASTVTDAAVEASICSEPDSDCEASSVHSSGACSTPGTSAIGEPDAELSGREEEDDIVKPKQKIAVVAAKAPACSLSVHEMLLWRATSEDLCKDAAFSYSVVEAKAVAQNTAPIVRSAASTSSQKSATNSKDRRESSEQQIADEAVHTVRGNGMKLQVSTSSWAAQQRARRSRAATDGEDEEVLRTMKSLLNKLTLEKFAELYEKLIYCGIRSTNHVELLIREVFEKATTQHHFIDMYADLCANLHEHFTHNPIGDDKFNFRRLLLNACQASFERNLEKPAGLDELDSEERSLAEAKFKTRMLGNIRFVGALLSRKMLAGKVLIAILEELVGKPTSEALESAACLLTAAGPTFDTPDWILHAALNGIFMQLKAVSQKKSCEPRVRCIIKDVLDLRAAGWKDRKPKKLEGPMKLEDVAKTQSAKNNL